SLSRRHLVCTLFPYTTLFRSSTGRGVGGSGRGGMDFWRRSSFFGVGVGFAIASSPVTSSDRSLRQVPGASPFRRTLPKAIRVSSDRKSTRLNSSHVKISYAVF